MKNLSEKSLLVGLVISQWSARKFDRKATSEVNSTHNTNDAGRFNKLLIAKEGLKAIEQISNKARTFHYENTLPWSDSGERLLPAQNYMEYVQRFNELKSEFNSAVSAFINDYPQMIEDAKANLNGLFNAGDYPNDIHERFKMRVSFMPVPDVADFRIDLSEVEISRLSQDIEHEMNERFATAQNSIYERIKDQLSKMYERLSDESNTFKNSLFENMRDLVDLLPRLNVSNDANISKMCKELATLYVDPQVVRNSTSIRATKANEVRAALSKIDSFLNPSA